jgi:hypothetical protein
LTPCLAYEFFDPLPSDGSQTKSIFDQRFTSFDTSIASDKRNYERRISQAVLQSFLRDIRYLPLHLFFDDDMLKLLIRFQSVSGDHVLAFGDGDEIVGDYLVYVRIPS